MARPSNTEERRAQIVEGLRLVMAERGYDGASVARIAAAAGMNSGLVHYHFRDKQQILLALVDRLSDDVRARADARLRSSDTPVRRLHAWIDTLLSLGPGADASSMRCWVMIGAESIRSSAVQERYELGCRLLLDELVRESAAALGLRPRSARARALGATVLSACQGALHLSCAAPGAFPAGTAASTVRALVDSALANAGER